MRHVVSLVLGIALGPVLLIGLGWSSTQLWNTDRLGVGTTGDLALGLLVCAACAAVFGLLLGSRRLSPLAGIGAGLPFIALMILAKPSAALQAVFSTNYAIGTGMASLAFTGTALFIGLLGIVPAVFPSRWRHGPVRPVGAHGDHRPHRPVSPS